MSVTKATLLQSALASSTGPTVLAHPLAAPAGDFPFRDDTQWGEEGEAERCLCLWRDRGRGPGMGEEGGSSTFDARRHDTRSPPSETADTTRDFPADPALDHIYLLPQLQTRTWSQAGITQPGS